MINFKAEKQIATENVALYHLIKHKTIDTVQRWRNIDPEIILNRYCESHDMKRTDFDFICTIEETMFNDEFRHGN